MSIEVQNNSISIEPNTEQVEEINAKLSNNKKFRELSREYEKHYLLIIMKFWSNHIKWDYRDNKYYILFQIIKWMILLDIFLKDKYDYIIQELNSEINYESYTFKIVKDFITLESSPALFDVWK